MSDLTPLSSSFLVLVARQWDGVKIKEMTYGADFAYGPEAENAKVYRDLLKSNGVSPGPRRC